MQRIWRRRGCRIWRSISCREGDGGVGTDGRGTCGGRDRWCGPGLTAFWGRTDVCSRMSLSGTPGTTRTITWSLGVYRVHPWRRRGGIRGAGSDGRCGHRRNHRGRTHSLLLYGEPYQNQRRGKREETLGSRQKRGDSSTRESPRARTRGKARRTGGGWGRRSGTGTYDRSEERREFQ